MKILRDDIETIFNLHKEKLFVSAQMWKVKITKNIMEKEQEN